MLQYSASGVAGSKTVTFPAVVGPNGQYEYMLQGLSPSTTYTLVLTGIDAQGRQGSAPVSVTFTTGAPDAKLDPSLGINTLTVTPISKSSGRDVTVSWVNGATFKLANIRIKCTPNALGQRRQTRKQYFGVKTPNKNMKTFTGLPASSTCFVFANALYSDGRRQGRMTVSFVTQ